MTTDVIRDDDNFAAAFDEAVKESQGEKKPAAPAVKEETPPADDPAAKKTAEDKAAADAKAAADQKVADEAAAAKKAEEDAAAAETKAEEDRRAALTEEQRKAEDTAAQETAARKAAEDKARLEVEARTAAEKKVADAAEKKAADDKARADQEAAEAKAKKDVEDLLKPYEYSEDEKKALEAYKRDFPEGYAVLESRMKAMEKANQAQAHKVMAGILQKVREVVAPLAEGYQQDSLERHKAAVKAAHADHEELVDLLPAWIEKQPAYLKTAYQAVYEGGTTADVIDLFAKFKADTGRTKPEPKPTPAPTPTPKPKPTADEIASGAPVGTRRATPSPRGTPDPNDFDGAFSEAAAAAAGRK